MEIVTRLLVADGDIVVIGGIKKNEVANSKDAVPGVSKVPILGKMFQGSSKSDKLILFTLASSAPLLPIFTP